MLRPKGWPSDCALQYISHNLYSPKIPDQIIVSHHPNPRSAKTVRAQRPSDNVRIRPITERDHPACGQHGLFATRKLKPGEHIVDYVGWVEEEQRESQTSDYILRFVDGLSIDGELMGNEGRFINDFRGVAAQANAGFRNYTHESGEVRMGVFVGRTCIAKGSEILLSYGKGFWHARQPGEEEWAEGTE